MSENTGAKQLATSPDFLSYIPPYVPLHTPTSCAKIMLRCPQNTLRCARLMENTLRASERFLSVFTVLRKPMSHNAQNVKIHRCPQNTLCDMLLRRPFTLKYRLIYECKTLLPLHLRSDNRRIQERA